MNPHRVVSRYLKTAAPKGLDVSDQLEQIEHFERLMPSMNFTEQMWGYGQGERAQQRFARTLATLKSVLVAVQAGKSTYKKAKEFGELLDPVLTFFGNANSYLDGKVSMVTQSVIAELKTFAAELPDKVLATGKPNPVAVLMSDKRIVRDGKIVGKITGYGRGSHRGVPQPNDYVLELSDGRRFSLSAYALFNDIKREIDYIVRMAETGDWKPL